MWQLNAWLELRRREEQPGDGEAAFAAELADREPMFNVWIRADLVGDRYVLTATGLTNHRDSRGQAWDELLAEVVGRLPGTYGLVYEHDDETDEPPGRNAFRVRVAGSGGVEERPDPFLSPAIPVVDAESDDLRAEIPVPGGTAPLAGAVPRRAGADGELHAWLALWESLDDDAPGWFDPALESPADRARRNVRDLQAIADATPWPELCLRYEVANGMEYLAATLHGPLDGPAAAFFETRLAATLDVFPASYGLVHERGAAEHPFTVRAIARGCVHPRQDPFLSP